jgi:predicted neuraminidase
MFCPGAATLRAQGPGSSTLAALVPLDHCETARARKGERVFSDSQVKFHKLPKQLQGMAFLRSFGQAGFTAMPVTTGQILAVTPDKGQPGSRAQELETAGFSRWGLSIASLFTHQRESLHLYRKQVNYSNFRLAPLSFEGRVVVFFSPDTLVSRREAAVVSTVISPGFNKKMRKWQGCPSIERTGGRLWASWFSGGSREPDAGNYGIVAYSDDNGGAWHDPAIVIHHPDSTVRVIDPELWKDPLGRLWIFWVQNQGVSGFDGLWSTWAVQLEHPDADTLSWTRPKRLCDGLMRNKPIVLSDGGWLLPSYRWAPDYRSAVYLSTDKGQSWKLQGGPVNLGSQNFYEHMVVELKDKRLWMLQRNIQESYSADAGKSWTKPAVVDGFMSANSRLYLGRLRSGNLLLVYNDDTVRKVRRTLTAFLSTDDGRTWPYKLVIDERMNVSYPDVAQGPDGRIYLCYDRGRTTDKEIILAVFDEKDIILGKLPEGYRPKMISKAGGGDPIGRQPGVSDSSFWVGAKKWPLHHFTAKGTPVVDMWNIAPAKDPLAYPALKAEHQLVWSPGNAAEGGYNHYTCLIRYKDKLFAMWANHPFGEDAPGQRVLYTVSGQWGKWSAPQELFAAPGPVRERHEKGIYCKPDRWVIVDDKLYAVVYVSGAGMYPIARQLAVDGKMGVPFPLDTLPARAVLPVYMQDTMVPVVAQKIKDWYRMNDKVSWWAAEGQGIDRRAVDGSSLIETFMYRAKDSLLVLMCRNWGTPSNPVHNNRVYVSFSNDRSRWSPAYPSNIPDAPTRGDAVRLSNGCILLIGTHYAPRLDEALYLDRDPLTVAVSKDGYTFDKVYSIRMGAPKTWHIPNVKGRNPGFAYTSSIIDSAFLYTLYSIGKEDIAISRVPLGQLSE